MSAELSIFAKLGGWFLSKIRLKEQNLKSYYTPYYEQAEALIVQHVKVFNWLGDECNTYTGATEEQIEESYRQMQEHNSYVYKKASDLANGKSIEDMRVDVINLVADLDGIVDQSLIDALNSYQQDLADADSINEYEFMVPVSRDLLNKIRELKGTIPTVHKNSKVH